MEAVVVCRRISAYDVIVRHSNGCAFSLLLLLLLLVTSTRISYGRPSEASRSSRGSDPCPRAMPCRWAVCPWSPRGTFSNADCAVIENTSCRCDKGRRCTLDRRSAQIVKYGDEPDLKFAFYCRGHHDRIHRHHDQQQQQQQQPAIVISRSTLQN